MFSKLVQTSSRQIASSTQRAGFNLSVQPPKISKDISEGVVPNLGFRPGHKPVSTNAKINPPPFCHVWMKTKYEQSQKFSQSKFY